MIKPLSVDFSFGETPICRRHTALKATQTRPRKDISQAHFTKTVYSLFSPLGKRSGDNQRLVKTFLHLLSCTIFLGRGRGGPQPMHSAIILVGEGGG